MGGSLQEIFERAIGLAPGERGPFLLRECAGDDALRAQVEALLAAHDRAGPFLGAPTATDAGAEAAPMHERPGARIGPYKLLQLIGEGGFGSVFLAEQGEPVRRRVALKIIKLGMDTRRVIARFEAERQALALMDHANIARVLDAGATETGRPYFVMELVKGEPITAYCDRNHLSITERLDLFTQVCHAVQHAHQKGIIHRDIKPGNVLVSTQDGRPLAKVIDFGIAKATDHRLTEKTLFTEHKALIGTPEYMSPEQAEGSLDIDTRTDVYSLGVLLYELLTGTTPFDAKELRSAAYAEVQRIIREVEPPKPSTRLSESADSLAGIAASRHTEPRRLGTMIRGELDWIVMKALEKDRARRYDSPGALASDLANHLAGEAVVAAPPSAAYRLRTFVRRRRGPVFAGALVFVGLAVGLGVALYQYRHARVERDAKSTALAAAESSAKKQAVIEDFLIHQMLGSGNADFGGSPSLTVREVLDRAAAQARDIADPEVRGAVRHELGIIYTSLGLFDSAEEQLRAALELRELRAGDAEALGDTLVALARVARVRGDMDMADGLLRRALSLADNGRVSLARARADSEWASALTQRGRWHEAAASLRSAESAIVSMGAEDQDPLLTADVLGGLGRYEVMQGRPEKGIELLMSAVAVLRRHPHGDALADWLVSLSEAMESAGRLDDAQRTADEAMELRLRVLPAGHPGIAHTLVKLAALRMRKGEFDRAEALAREAVGVYARSLGAEHEFTAAATVALAAALASQERWQEAVDECARAAAIYMDQFQSDDWRLASARSMQGACLTELSKFDESEKLLLQSYEALERTKVRIDLLQLTVQRLADLYTRWDKPERAAEWLARTKSVEGPHRP